MINFMLSQVEQEIFCNPDTQIAAELHRLTRVLEILDVASTAVKGDGNPDDYYVLYERS